MPRGWSIVGALIEPHLWFVESVATRLPTRKPFGIAASSSTRLLLARVPKFPLAGRRIARSP